jgi:hypothetical protein
MANKDVGLTLFISKYQERNISTFATFFCLEKLIINFTGKKFFFQNLSH